jgi:dTMP kinase
MPYKQPMVKCEMKGLLIVIEGMDQSGKKTQTNLLASRLRKADCPVEMISFPDYTTPIGREIRKYLDGKRDFGPEIRQFLYVANRWERKKTLENWLGKGRVVIADRYTQSNLAYGLANGLDLQWMINLEQGLPKADVTIVLDIPVDTAFRRRKTMRDMYERDKAFLKRIRSSYHTLAKKFGWFLVNGEAPPETVAENIWKIISRFKRTKAF